MTTTPMKRLVTAVAVVAGWAAITLIGGLAQSGQGSLASLVSKQVTWATPAAALFLLVSAKLFGWRDLGLNPPRPRSSLRLFWLIAIYILFLGAIAALTKDFTTRMLLIIAINTAFVGFSEELAFRGVLWGAARNAMSFWPGVIFVSAMFGGIHILNAAITGQVGEAAVQALNASLSGLAYLELRIRTRSLFPIMVAHWLWDLAVFLNASGSEASSSGPGASLLIGAALVAPIALYGLWLIRNRKFHFVTDEIPEIIAGRTTASRAAEKV